MDDIATRETHQLIASDKVEGTAVYSRSGDHLGSIRNFMVNKRSGQVDYAVLQFGGFLGIGNSFYPLPWDMLTYDENQGGYVVDIEKSRLDNAPSYDDRTPDYDESYSRQVSGYWGSPYPYA